MIPKILIVLLLVFNVLEAQTKIEHLDIDSKHIDETRTIHIALPKDYHKSTKKYPIILILDHGLLFNTTSAIVNQLSSTSRMPESIVISMSPGEKHRSYFAPNLYSNNRNRKYNYGDNQEKFVQFLEYDLLPLIEKKYRVNSFKSLIGFFSIINNRIAYFIAQTQLVSSLYLFCRGKYYRRWL